MRPILFVLLLLMMGCNSRPDNLVGTYSWTAPNTQQIFFRGILFDEAFMGGGQIELHQDSTFVFSYPSFKQMGQWTVDGDTLLLKSSSKIEMLNNAEGEEEPIDHSINFEISGDELIRIVEITEKKRIEILKKD